MKRMLTVAVLLACGLSHARNPDGTLGIIIAPNEGTPAIVAPGGEFAVLLREERDLVLVSDTIRLPLMLESLREFDGHVEAWYRIPIQARPGSYDIETAGTDRDRIAGVVYVVDSDLAEYDVVVLNPDTPARWSEQMAQQKSEQLTIALIPYPTAPSAAARTQLLEALTQSNTPTIVIPGIGDPHAFEAVFGPAVYAVSVGRDAYLRFPSGRGLAGKEGRLHELRRSIRAARWSVGVSPASWETWDLRTQLTLLVDDPLDVHFAMGAPKTERKNPWGTTLFYAGPGALQATYRVTPQGIAPK